MSEIWGNSLESKALCGGLKEEDDMSDDKTLRGPQDSSRIAMGEDYEVQYWTKKFGVSRDVLADAVESVGTSAQAVADFLGKRV